MNKIVRIVIALIICLLVGYSASTVTRPSIETWFFLIQLTLNAIWSYLFFGLKNPMLALIEIALLELMIYETYLKFTKINKIAGYLLIPYMAWVAFAGILNASIWWLNK